MAKNVDQHDHLIVSSHPAPLIERCKIRDDQIEIVQVSSSKKGTDGDENSQGSVLECPCVAHLEDKKYYGKQLSWNDVIVLDNSKFTRIWSTALLLNSLVLSLFASGVLFLLVDNFAGHILNRRGLLFDFSLTHCLCVNASLGIFEATLIITCFQCRVKPSQKVQVCIIYISCAVTLTSLSLWIYTLGVIIKFSDAIEQFMLDELGSMGGSSIHWANSQQFYGCCGITSFRNWDWNASSPVNIRTSLYPPSCCDKSISVYSCQNSPTVAEVFTRGCLKHEENTVMGVAYSAFLLMSLQLHLQFFAMLAVLKIYARQRFVFEHADCCRLQCTPSNEKIQGYDCCFHQPDIDKDNNILNANVPEHPLKSRNSSAGVFLKRVMTV